MWMKAFAATMSLIVPGLGQLLQIRPIAFVLFISGELFVFFTIGIIGRNYEEPWPMFLLMIWHILSAIDVSIFNKDAYWDLVLKEQNAKRGSITLNQFDCIECLSNKSREHFLYAASFIDVVADGDVSKLSKSSAQELINALYQLPLK